jgi:hypothetical protein
MNPAGSASMCPNQPSERRISVIALASSCLALRMGAAIAVESRHRVQIESNVLSRGFLKELLSELVKTIEDVLRCGNGVGILAAASCEEGM